LLPSEVTQAAMSPSPDFKRRRDGIATRVNVTAAQLL
jgi:hypothetical protein